MMKDKPIRSEAYRRLVAALPCVLCGIEGSSQAAHPNTGKGLGIKTSDLICFPLCHEGANGCHVAWDQRRYFVRDSKARQAEMEPYLAEKTQRRLIANATPKERELLISLGLVAS